MGRKQKRRQRASAEPARNRAGGWRVLAFAVLGLAILGAWVYRDGMAGPQPQSGDDPVSHEATRASRSGPRVERLRVRVHAELPHDPRAFTQGLLVHRGELYESLGQYGSSALRRWKPATGELVRQVELAPDHFGEGLALVDDRLIQLTWRSGLALVYDRESLERVSSFEYSGEGWGLTFDGEALVMSDGSDTLTFRDPRTFRPLRRLRVTLEGQPLGRLNELEWADGSVYANVWLEDRIMRIDPVSGQVQGVIDASGLLGGIERARADVLNGIAYDPDSRRFVITGKYWPRAFEVEFVPVDPPR